MWSRREPVRRGGPVIEVDLCFVGSRRGTAGAESELPAPGGRDRRDLTIDRRPGTAGSFHWIARF
jgi:hypothetical protein